MRPLFSSEQCFHVLKSATTHWVSAPVASLCPCIWGAGQGCTSVPVSPLQGLVEKVECCARFSHRHLLLCTVCFFRQEELAGRGQEGGRHLQPLEILSFIVENHPEFPRQKEATTFCLLFLEFLFFSEQLIKDLRTAARKPFPLQSPQLYSQCAGCPLHRGQRHILLLEAERSGPMAVTLERLHLQIYLWCRSWDWIMNPFLLLCFLHPTKPQEC